MNDDKTALLVRGNDVREDLRSLDRLLDSFFGGPARSARPQSGWAPSMDIRETDKELVVYAALPGLSKEDVSLEVKDNVLSVSGRIKPLGSDEDTWLRREMPRGEFYRAFHLSADSDASKVKASMRDGVLEIRLPKAEEARPRKISID